MNRWRSYEGAAAILLWLIICVIAWSGCGNDEPGYNALLPNGYSISGWSWGETWIEDPQGEHVDDGHYAVAQCQIVDDLFFGTYFDDNDPTKRVRSYFLIDSASDMYTPYSSESKWSDALKEHDISQVTLVHPSALADTDTDFAVFRPAAGILISLVVFVALGILAIAKQERRLRHDRLDRL